MRVKLINVCKAFSTSPGSEVKPPSWLAVLDQGAFIGTDNLHAQNLSRFPSWLWNAEAASHSSWHIKQPVVLAKPCYLSE